MKCFACNSPLTFSSNMIANNGYDWRIYNLTFYIRDSTNAASDGGLFYIGIVGNNYDSNMNVSSIDDYNYKRLNIESYWFSYNSFYEVASFHISKYIKKYW